METRLISSGISDGLEARLWITATARFYFAALPDTARTRRGRPLTSQAIAVLLRNQLYAGIVDVTEYGIRGKRGDFEPLISEDLFYRVQSVPSGRMPSTTPKQRAHADFPLRGFVRCASCGRGVTGSWSKGRGALRFEVPLGEGAARTGLEVALEAEGGLLIRELDGDVQLPWASHRRVRAATVVVVRHARPHIGRKADVELR